MRHGRIWRQNRERAGALTRPCQLQHQVVPADQQIGLGVLRQCQKDLVIRIPAFGQRRHIVVASPHGHNRQMVPVALQQFVAAGRVQAELGVARHTLEFSQGVCVGQTDDLVFGNGLTQPSQRRCQKMKKIHDHVGVQHQTWRCRSSGRC